MGVWTDRHRNGQDRGKDERGRISRMAPDPARLLGRVPGNYGMVWSCGRKMVENGRFEDMQKAWNLRAWGAGGRSGSTTTGGGHGPINGENESQNPGAYSDLHGMPSPDQAHGKGSSFSDVLEDLSQGADIARTPGAANRGEVRAVLFRVQGPIPTSRTARAITCSSRCRRTRDKRRKAAEHLPGNDFCIRCRCDISHRRPNAIYCYLCYRINDQYREKISRRKHARACSSCGAFTRELVPWSLTKGLCLICLAADHGP